MSSRRALTLSFALLALALLIWRLWPTEAQPPSATPPARHARTYKSGARTPLPHQARKPATGTSPASAAAPSRENSAPASPPAGSQGQVSDDPAMGSDPPAPSGPVDRREHPPADAEQVRAAIMERMEDVSQDISSCLGEWMALDPDLEGQVNIGFQLNADGLQDAYVVDHSDVPLGPLSCFAAAVGEVDWAGVTADPLEVTFPFTFSSEGGSAE